MKGYKSSVLSMSPMKSVQARTSSAVRTCFIQTVKLSEIHIRR
ncbi:hypothetical protein PO124_15065 [Bacillus licheniformis]|nr:hypothetical protein [Bacillus licheniformis]